MSLVALSPADWTIVIYGLLALILGVIGLAKSDLQFRMMGIEPPSAGKKGTLRWRPSAQVRWRQSIWAYYTPSARFFIGVAFQSSLSTHRSLMGIGFIFMMATGRAPRQFKGAAIWEFRRRDHHRCGHALERLARLIRTRWRLAGATASGREE